MVSWDKMMSFPSQPPLVLIISPPCLLFLHLFRLSQISVAEVQRAQLSAPDMASITMTASLIGGFSNAVRSSVNRRQVVMAKAARADDGVEQQNVSGDQSNNTRRNLMFAAAASAVCSASSGCGVALADEPKRGSPEAKKKYAPICVTMPTASVCRN